MYRKESKIKLRHGFWFCSEYIFDLFLLLMAYQQQSTFPTLNVCSIFLFGTKLFQRIIRGYKINHTLWFYYVLGILEFRLNTMSNTIFRISPADLDAVWLPTSHFLLLIQNCVCQMIFERKIFSYFALFHFIEADILFIIEIIEKYK